MRVFFDLSTEIHFYSNKWFLYNQVMISKESLQQFKEIYQKEFGAELSDEDTLRKVIQLLELYRTVYGIEPEDLSI